MEANGDTVLASVTGKIFPTLSGRFGIASCLCEKRNPATLGSATGLRKDAPNSDTVLASVTGEVFPICQEFLATALSFLTDV